MKRRAVVVDTEALFDLVLMRLSGEIDTTGSSFPSRADVLRFEGALRSYPARVFTTPGVLAELQRHARERRPHDRECWQLVLDILDDLEVQERWVAVIGNPSWREDLVELQAVDTGVIALALELHEQYRGVVYVVVKDDRLRGGCALLMGLCAVLAAELPLDRPFRKGV